MSALALALLGPNARGADGAAPGAVHVDPALETFRSALADPDPVLRALAAFELRHHAEDGAVHLLAGALAPEREDTVLGCLLGSLEGRARPDLVAEGGAMLPGLLLRLLSHRHPLVRDRAAAVLRSLGGTEPGRDAHAWERWWLESRASLDEAQRTLLAARRAARENAPRTAPGSGTAAAPPPPDLVEHAREVRRDGLDLVIVIDSTGSMGPYIGEATRRAATLVARLAWLVPRFRAGLVTYDDQARLRIELTPDGGALEKAFSRVGAGGGGDYEEGVDQGIYLALRQEALGWSRRAYRVIVVIGDAPPHEGDVAGLVRRLASARDDPLYDHPVVVHTVSTTPERVEHFDEIATAGHGAAVALPSTGRLESEIVALAFGAPFPDRVRAWLDEVEALRHARPR